jgi:hypothetical protein
MDSRKQARYEQWLSVKPSQEDISRGGFRRPELTRLTMTAEIVIYDGETGFPLVCEKCGKPASQMVNISALQGNDRGKSDFKPRCIDHLPCKITCQIEPNPNFSG